MAITHAFTSGIADGGDTTLVRPVDWNAEHVGLKVIRKTADEAVNNSATLQNDDHLLFAIAANEVWEANFVLDILGGATATTDIKFAMTIPTGCTMVWGGVFSRAGGTTTLELGLCQTTSGAQLFCDLEFASERRIMKLWGIFVNGATAGNVQLQWAQRVAVVEDTTIKANSCIIAHQLA